MQLLLWIIISIHKIIEKNIRNIHASTAEIIIFCHICLGFSLSNKKLQSLRCLCSLSFPSFSRNNHYTEFRFLLFQCIYNLKLSSILPFIIYLFHLIFTTLEVCRELYSFYFTSKNVHPPRLSQFYSIKAVGHEVLFTIHSACHYK